MKTLAVAIVQTLVGLAALLSVFVFFEDVWQMRSVMAVYCLLASSFVLGWPILSAISSITNRNGPTSVSVDQGKG